MSGKSQTNFGEICEITLLSENSDFAVKFAKTHFDTQKLRVGCEIPDFTVALRIFPVKFAKSRFCQKTSDFGNF